MATLYIKKGIVSQYIMQNLWIEQPVLYANILLGREVSTIV